MAKQRNKDKVLPRAVTYLRFAVADTDGHKEAVAKHICQWRANELGAIIVSVYSDIASGWTDDRKHLQRMLSDLAESGEISYVIVPDHLTIAQNMHLYGRISWKIEQAGARIIVATVPLENYRDMKPNQLGVLHAVADWATGEPSSGPTDKKVNLPPVPLQTRRRTPKPFAVAVDTGRHCIGNVETLSDPGGDQFCYRPPSCVTPWIAAATPNTRAMPRRVLDRSSYGDSARRKRLHQLFPR